MNQLCANNQLSERSQLKITAIVELKCTVVTIPHYFQLSVFLSCKFRTISNHSQSCLVGCSVSGYSDEECDCSGKDPTQLGCYPPNPGGGSRRVGCGGG